MSLLSGRPSMSADHTSDTCVYILLYLYAKQSPNNKQPDHFIEKKPASPKSIPCSPIVSSSVGWLASPKQKHLFKAVFAILRRIKTAIKLAHVSGVFHYPGFNLFHFHFKELIRWYLQSPPLYLSLILIWPCLKKTAVNLQHFLPTCVCWNLLWRGRNGKFQCDIFLQSFPVKTLVA